MSDTGPIWLRSVQRVTQDGIKLCNIPKCANPLTAKGLCAKHYQQHKQGRLDEETGEPLKFVTVHPAFGKPENWVYLRDTKQIMNVVSGEKITAESAGIAFGRDVIYMIRDGKIAQFRGESFHPDIQRPDYYNSWKVLDSMKATTDKQVKLLPEMEELLRNLGHDDFEYLLQWLAYGLRYPGQPTVALSLFGVPGSGKSTLATILREIYGPYHETVGVAAIESEFNSWLEKKLIITAEEISLEGFREKARIKDVLKSYVIGGTVNINRKGIPHYTIDNLSRWLFFSNSSKPIPLDANDRRFSIIKQTTPVSPYIGGEINTSRQMYAQNLVNYLHNNVNLESFDTMLPLDNQARKDVIREQTTHAVVVPMR